MENGGREELQSLRMFQPAITGFEDKGNGPGDKKCAQPLEAEKSPSLAGRQTNKNRDLSCTTQCTKLASNLNEQENRFLDPCTP